MLTHPHVTDAAVVGIPDAERGEVPRAYVALSTHASEHEMAIAEIKKAVHGSL